MKKLEKTMKNLKKSKKQQIAIVCVGGVVLILIVVLVLVLTLKGKPNENEDNPTSDGKIVQDVEPEEAEEMYTTLTDACTGALVWNIGVGDVVEINDIASMNACQNDNYYSRLVGYTYDLDSNLVMHVNVLKRVDNQLYRLDDTYVGEYNEETLHDSLSFGTTYEYLYQKLSEDNYKLVQVKLMELSSTEEAPQPEESTEGDVSEPTEPTESTEE